MRPAEIHHIIWVDLSTNFKNIFIFYRLDFGNVTTRFRRDKDNENLRKTNSKTVFVSSKSGGKIAKIESVKNWKNKKMFGRAIQFFIVRTCISWKPQFSEAAPSQNVRFKTLHVPAGKRTLRICPSNGAAASSGQQAASSKQQASSSLSRIGLPRFYRLDLGDFTTRF